MMFVQSAGVPHHLARTSTLAQIPTDPVYAKYSAANIVTKKDGNSPIPKDPTCVDASEYKVTTPKPRVKLEALNIARNHQGRDLAYLFNPAFKIIPIGVKPTQSEPRDHGKENHRKIKEIQKANREKQQHDSSRRTTPVKAVYKPDKFEHVQSVVAQHIQTPAAPRVPSPVPKLYRSKSASDIRKTSSRDVKTIQSSRNHINTSRENRTASTRDKLNDSNTVNTNKNITKRPSSARRKENGVAQKRTPRPASACEVERKKKETSSHIALNKQAVQKVKLRRNPSNAALDELKEKKDNDIAQHKRGDIPKYLRNRQSEWKKAEEERVANLPDPSIPPGHSLMAEEERIKTVVMLQKSQQDMLAELLSIPLSRDTMRIKTRKDLLERKLTEVDTALKIFSRPRVFIKDE